VPDTPRSDTPQSEAIRDTVAELFSSYVDAIRDTQIAAQHSFYTAGRNYFEAVQKYLRELPMQDAIRSNAEAVHTSWVKQDAQQYLESSRQYANSVQDAYVSIQRNLQEANTRLVEELQGALKAASDAQKTQFESFLRSLQQAFSAQDITKLDSASLARMSQTMLAAAWMRANSS
jgi:hypothetical protein